MKIDRFKPRKSSTQAHAHIYLQIRTTRRFKEFSELVYFTVSVQIKKFYTTYQLCCNNSGENKEWVTDIITCRSSSLLLHQGSSIVLIHCSHKISILFLVLREGPLDYIPSGQSINVHLFHSCFDLLECINSKQYSTSQTNQIVISFLL